MANPIVVRGEFYSEALGMMTKISVILPASILTNKHGNQKYRSLYLLCGAGGDSESALHELQLAHFANADCSDLIIVIPNGNFSFWCDYVLEYRYAHQYYTYLTKELVQIIRTLYPVSEKPEDTAIYGCSHGGWGAFLCGLNNPETFGHVGSQSGMVDMQWAINVRPFMLTKHKRQFGQSLDISGSKYDLYSVTAQLERSAQKGLPTPRIYQGWGEQDYLLEINEKMHEHLSSLSHLDYTAMKIPGEHGWGTNNQGWKNFICWLNSK